MINKINFLFVTLFGIGKTKKFPGTLASFATIIFLFFLFHIVKIAPYFVFFSLIIVFFVSLYSVKIYIKDLVEKDSSEIVIDEYIGQSIPICLYELAHSTHEDADQILQSYLIMFVLFRIFDIIKPFPVSYFDKNFKNSFGIIMDDVCAGFYVVSVLVLYIILI